MAVSAIAECIQYYRGHLLTEDEFRRGNGTTKALVGLEIPDGLRIVDLDDAAQLAARRIRPSQVATMRRPVTQRIATTVFDEGAVGLAWWSTLEAEWTNVTLFYERALPHVSIALTPRTLSLDLPDVQEAARHLDIEF